MAFDNMQVTQQIIAQRIGGFVIVSQTLESLLRPILTFAIQDGKPLTIEALQTLDKKYRRATVGTFFGQLRERVDFDQRLEEILDRYLDNRNRLIHRFAELEGHAMQTADDLAQLDTFLTCLARDFWTLLRFFFALLRAWTKQVELEIPHEPCYDEPLFQQWLRQADALEPHLDQLIFKTPVEPPGPANGSQPTGPHRNRTSAAAGSRR